MNSGLNLNVDVDDQEPIKTRLAGGGAALAPKTDICLAQPLTEISNCLITYDGEGEGEGEGVPTGGGVRWTRCRAPRR